MTRTVTVEQAILLAQALVGIVREQLGDLPDPSNRLRIIASQFRELMRQPQRVGRA
jgi:hypothetical protein